MEVLNFITNIILIGLLLLNSWTISSNQGFILEKIKELKDKQN